jgi:hypothetical protein
MANTAPTVRPVVFVGSSSEGLELAKIIQVLLDANNDVELWDQGVFGLSHGTLESLVGAIPRFDFAVLVLTADDLLLSRGTEKQTARDNVLLELGLFMGGLGRDRTFIIYDRENSPKLPSDLAGVKAATFRRHASGNLQSSLGAPCSQIEQAIKICGVRTERLTPALSAPRVNVISKPNPWTRSTQVAAATALNYVPPSLDYVSMIRKCTEEGRKIEVGFAPGIEKLPSTPLETLRRKRYKWDWIDPSARAPGNKIPNHWINGEDFLHVCQQKKKKRQNPRQNRQAQTVQAFQARACSWPAPPDHHRQIRSSSTFRVLPLQAR